METDPRVESLVAARLGERQISLGPPRGSSFVWGRSGGGWGPVPLICLATPRKRPCLPQHLELGYPPLWLCGLWDQLVRGWKDHGQVGTGQAGSQGGGHGEARG